VHSSVLEHVAGEVDREARTGRSLRVDSGLLGMRPDSNSATTLRCSRAPLDKPCQRRFFALLSSAVPSFGVGCRMGRAPVGAALDGGKNSCERALPRPKLQAIALRVANLQRVLTCARPRVP